MEYSYGQIKMSTMAVLLTVWNTVAANGNLAINSTRVLGSTINPKGRATSNLVYHSTADKLETVISMGKVNKCSKMVIDMKVSIRTVNLKVKEAIFGVMAQSIKDSSKMVLGMERVFGNLEHKNIKELILTINATVRGSIHGLVEAITKEVLLMIWDTDMVK